MNSKENLGNWSKEELVKELEARTNQCMAEWLKEGVIEAHVDSFVESTIDRSILRHLGITQDQWSKDEYCIEHNSPLRKRIDKMAEQQISLLLSVVNAAKVVQDIGVNSRMVKAIRKEYSRRIEDSIHEHIRRIALDEARKRIPAMIAAIIENTSEKD